MKNLVNPVTLQGKHICLEPLSLEHAEGLAKAASDGELWNLWYSSVPHPDQVEHYITQALAQQKSGCQLAFAVRQMQGEQCGPVIGSTRYCNIDAINRRPEIGYTWYGKSHQGTKVNAEAKLLLLQHAFETLHCIAVEFRTHWMNQRSRAAIARLGAKQDGILRNHMMINGTLRDTVVFSIIESEW
ncbi:MAG: GNAT family N-acetyltransferase, partial [Enterobacteriaceae bacterium]